MNIVLVGSKKLDHYRDEYPNAKIWVFEDKKTAYNRLMKKLPNRVYVDNISISDFIGREKDKEVTTLANLFERIDFLVIDGSPTDVLKGLAKLRPQHIDCRECGWLRKNKYVEYDGVYELEN